ncbi:hypothetical protein PDIG_56850 [Penicillium digitatum PHI26]|uniref:Uncharacterized protein n=2 Tax=Penicillium digitatum TaxID=36651 RepID=K9GAU3_PEND2|nr:hypothetical protein PDIP_66410 [Penicillium digitatum Pd1]EKV09130.1 hypothetical protein PDIP_66410 [Penicillium digitatum Pd1]EKV10396.1 hypothetical protein PDIG_56850 [Penicillium digitatum PHI26]
MLFPPTPTAGSSSDSGNVPLRCCALQTYIISAPARVPHQQLQLLHLHTEWLLVSVPAQQGLCYHERRGCTER